MYTVSFPKLSFVKDADFVIEVVGKSETLSVLALYSAMFGIPNLLLNSVMLGSNMSLNAAI